MRMLKKKALFVISAAFYAFWYFYLTQVIYSNVDGHIVSAVILNMLLILLFVISEKIENYFLKKIKSKETTEKPGVFKRILMAYFGGASFKSALYFFYIFFTIYSAIHAADPDFFPFRFSDSYLLSVRYGILFLLAADKFFEQIFKDITKK